MSATRLRRIDLVRRILAHEAAAAACKRALKGEAERVFNDEGSADTWRLPGTGMVTVNVSHGRAVVVDEAAFMQWLEARFPTEVETVTVKRVRNAEWLKGIMGALAGVDPEELAAGEETLALDDEGTIVPGTVWRKGGEFVSASVKPDADLRRALAHAAERYAAGELDGTSLPGLNSARPVGWGEKPADLTGGEG